MELIQAHSPQAKGRVERVNRTLQDRLVKELTRAGISDLESANRYLEQTYLALFNARFGRVASKPADLHRALPEERLLRVLSMQTDRVVRNDWTVRWQNGFLQLPPASAEQVQPGDAVVVSEQLDGRLRLFAGECELAWSAAGAPPARLRTRSRRLLGAPTGSNQGQKPRADHPWRGRRPAPPSAAAVALACSASVAALPALRSPTPPRE